MVAGLENYIPLSDLGGIGELNTGNDITGVQESSSLSSAPLSGQFGGGGRKRKQKQKQKHKNNKSKKKRIRRTRGSKGRRTKHCRCKVCRCKTCTCNKKNRHKSNNLIGGFPFRASGKKYRKKDRKKTKLKGKRSRGKH